MSPPVVQRVTFNNRTPHWNVILIIYYILGILCDSSSIHDIQSVWMKILQQNCSLLCYRKDTNAIVGLYILGVAVSGVLPEFQFTGDVWPELQMLYGYVHNQFDAFASYNVDKYFLSAGLSVEPEYRGRGIGTELVKSG